MLKFQRNVKKLSHFISINVILSKRIHTLIIHCTHLRSKLRAVLLLVNFSSFKFFKDVFGEDSVTVAQLSTMFLNLLSKENISSNGGRILEKLVERELLLLVNEFSCDLVKPSRPL